MNRAELERVISSGESEILEFKRSTGQLTRGCETLCGFLNASGGQVLFGVTSEGRIIGQKVADKTLQSIANELKQFEPPPTVEIEQIPLDDADGNEVIILRAIPRAESQPYTFNGRPYQRVGTTTSVMPRERYQQLLLEQAHKIHRWENQPDPRLNMDELDHEEILRTVRLGVAVGRLPESTGSQIPDILRRLGLLQEGVLLRATAVLFGTQFLPDYPQCLLRLARFKGIDKSEFMDHKQVHGHAFHLLEEAMLFLGRHLPVAGRIVPGVLERQDEPLFPLEALREALVNALCHRNYSHPGGSMSVAIYDDRLEIWNDGPLPFGLTPEDLKRDHDSRPPNPLIAGVFFRRGLIEQWGRGTQKIVSLCVKAGHPEPEFGEQAGSVWIRFLPSSYIAPHRIAHDLTSRQREILQTLSGASLVSFQEIQTQISNPPSERTLRNELIHLRNLGLVRLQGRGRGAKWSLVRDGEK